VNTQVQLAAVCAYKMTELFEKDVRRITNL